MKADNDPANIRNAIIYGLELNPVTVVQNNKTLIKLEIDFYLWSELKELIDNYNKTAGESIINPNFRLLILFCIYTAGQRPWG